MEAEKTVKPCQFVGMYFWATNTEGHTKSALHARLN